MKKFNPLVIFYWFLNVSRKAKHLYLDLFKISRSSYSLRYLDIYSKEKHMVCTRYPDGLLSIRIVIKIENKNLKTFTLKKSHCKRLITVTGDLRLWWEDTLIYHWERRNVSVTAPGQMRPIRTSSLSIGTAYRKYVLHYRRTKEKYCIQDS